MYSQVEILDILMMYYTGPIVEYSCGHRNGA